MKFCLCVNVFIKAFDAIINTVNVASRCRLPEKATWFVCSSSLSLVLLFIQRSQVNKVYLNLFQVIVYWKIKNEYFKESHTKTDK